MVIVSFVCSQAQFLLLRDRFVKDSVDFGYPAVRFSHLTGVFEAPARDSGLVWKFEFMLSGRCAVSSPACAFSLLSFHLFGARGGVGAVDWLCENSI